MTHTSVDLHIDHGPTIPAWALIATRMAATAGMALACQLPTWVVVLAPLLAFFPSGSALVLITLGFGAVVGWLPERAALGSGDQLYPTSWWAAIALTLLLLTICLISARLTDKVSAQAGIELRAIATLTWRYLPALVIIEVIWALAVFVIGPRASLSPVFLIIGALCLAGMCLAILYFFAPVTAHWQRRR